jgi:hypothetical protein
VYRKQEKDCQYKERQGGPKTSGVETFHERYASTLKSVPDGVKNIPIVQRIKGEVKSEAALTNRQN